MSNAASDGNGITSRGRVLVGVDGSAGADRALRWAVQEAASRKMELRVLVAWMYPATGGFVIIDSYGQFAEGAREILDKAMARVAELEPSVPVKGELWEEPPSQALIEASREADLLVVGSRGLGGFRGLLLGSVSQHCVQHAACPVLVVRPRAGGHQDENDEAEGGPS
jgi:nucleotide-binding universal stress UspA family protein